MRNTYMYHSLHAVLPHTPCHTLHHNLHTLHATNMHMACHVLHTSRRRGNDMQRARHVFQATPSAVNTAVSTDANAAATTAVAIAVNTDVTDSAMIPPAPPQSSPPPGRVHAGMNG